MGRGEKELKLMYLLPLVHTLATSSYLIPATESWHPNINTNIEQTQTALTLTPSLHRNARWDRFRYPNRKRKIMLVEKKVQHSARPANRPEKKNKSNKKSTYIPQQSRLLTRRPQIDRTRTNKIVKRIRQTPTRKRFDLPKLNAHPFRFHTLRSHPHFYRLNRKESNKQAHVRQFTSPANQRRQQ